jgi:hypothetical protein
MLQPQDVLRLLKSPINIKGFGSWSIIFLISKDVKGVLSSICGIGSYKNVSDITHVMHCRWSNTNCIDFYTINFLDFMKGFTNKTQKKIKK